MYLRERPHRNGRRRYDSFPSGHTTGATALALTTAYVLHRERLISTRRAVALAVGAPAIMGAYRVIADDHWATDVFAGWVLGSAVALGDVPHLGKEKASATPPCPSGTIDVRSMTRSSRLPG